MKPLARKKVICIETFLLICLTRAGSWLRPTTKSTVRAVTGSKTCIASIAACSRHKDYHVTPSRICWLTVTQSLHMTVARVGEVQAKRGWMEAQQHISVTMYERGKLKVEKNFFSVKNGMLRKWKIPWAKQWNDRQILCKSHTLEIYTFFVLDFRVVLRSPDSIKNFSFSCEQLSVVFGVWGTRRKIMAWLILCQGFPRRRDLTSQQTLSCALATPLHTAVPQGLGKKRPSDGRRNDMPLGMCKRNLR